VFQSSIIDPDKPPANVGGLIPIGGYNIESFTLDRTAFVVFSNKLFGLFLGWEKPARLFTGF
jgi:hypothetical protein